MEEMYDKPQTAELVDKVVSCEVPDKTIDQVMHKLVGKTYGALAMLHLKSKLSVHDQQ